MLYVWKIRTASEKVHNFIIYKCHLVFAVLVPCPSYYIMNISLASFKGYAVKINKTVFESEKALLKNNISDMRGN